MMIVKTKPKLPNVPMRMIMYDVMYSLADKLIKIYNPCKITIHPTEGVICADDRPCCRGCRYITESGCTVKCLRCKLYLCWPIYDYPQYFLLGEQLRVMRNIADRFWLLAMRTSRDYIRSELVKVREYMMKSEEVTVIGNF